MLEIQRLRVGEEERLRKIRLAALKDAPYAFGTTFQEEITYPESSWTKQLQELPTFVAVLDKIDSGIVRSSPHPRETARGSGLSEVLIDAVIDWARTERYGQLVLDVSDDNKFAIALYKSKGFQATGITNSFPYPRAHIKEHEMAMDL